MSSLVLRRSRQKVSGDLTVSGNISIDEELKAPDTTSRVIITGGNGVNNGANAVFFGGSHASNAGEGFIRSGTNKVIEWGNQTLGFFSVTPVAQPAAYTPTNVSADRAYDANSTTTAELADVLGTLISDLQGLGLVG